MKSKTKEEMAKMWPKVEQQYSYSSYFKFAHKYSYFTDSQPWIKYFMVTAIIAQVGRNKSLESSWRQLSCCRQAKASTMCFGLVSKQVITRLRSCRPNV